jgi:hypothetical protein
MYPSVVCVIAFGAESNTPSCTLHAVCRYWVSRNLGSSAAAGCVVSTNMIHAVGIALRIVILNRPQ